MLKNGADFCVDHKQYAPLRQRSIYLLVEIDQNKFKTKNLLALFLAEYLWTSIIFLPILDSELVEGFSVENSYMDEKIDAIDALGDFAKHCGKSFKPHLDVCLEEVDRYEEQPKSNVILYYSFNDCNPERLNFTNNTTKSNR